MKLKSLELMGFKSFAERTQIEFSKGVTAIVGPNGSGKSNIVDAIRWVMGETAPSFIRTKLLDDVIFSGSETSPPTGMAEVTITFDNTEGLSPVGLESYAEIQVTRRAYRDGESEFFINKTPCRLKDIVEMFLDTGSGARGYCIIEQSKVQQIISAKAEEKRILIEEAAGVAKYRMRKKEALRKLDSTKQNLARVSDILLEVNRQLRSIDRQARKAQRYKEMRERFRNHELELLRRKGVKKSGEDLEIKESLEVISRDLRIWEDKVQSLLSLEQEKRNSIFGLETELESLRQELAGANESFFRLDGGLEGINRELGEMEERREALRGEIEGMKEEILRIGEKVSEIRCELGRADEELSCFLERPEGDEELSDSSDTLRELREKCEEKREALVEILSMAGSFEDAVRINEKWIAETERKVGHLEKDLAQLVSDIRDLEEKEAECLSREEGINGELDRLGKEIQSDTHALSVVDRDILRVEEQILSINGEREKVSSRLQALSHILERNEIYGDSVSFIMEKFQSEQTGAEIVGVLGNLIKVEKGYERAVEAALGETLSYVIVKNTKDGVLAIRELKEKERGRAHFAPVRLRRRTVKTTEVPAGEGVISPMWGIISTGSECRDIIENLLGDVVLVNSMEDAVRLWKANGSWATYVSLDGDLLHPNGVISGGSTGSGEGILTKKRELAELESRLLEIEKSFLSHQGTLATYRKEKGVRVKRLEKNRENFDELEKEKYTVRVELEYVSRELEKQKKRSRWGDGELAHLGAELTRFLGQNEERQGKVEGGKIRAEGLQEEIGKLREEIVRLEGAQKVREEEVGRRQVLKVELREKKNRLSQERDSLERLKLDRRKFLERAGEELSGIDGKSHMLEEKKRETVDKLARLEDLRRKFEGRVGEKMEALGGLKGRLNGILKESSAISTEMEGRREEAASLRERRAELRTRLEGIREMARGSYGIENITLYESGEEIMSLSEEQLAEELEGMRTRIGALGEVNLEAIEEREELAGRSEDLTSQKEDLEKSMGDLMKVIDKIDRVSRERFTSMFSQVNEKFQELFPKLFMGGRGELVLTNTEDLLHSGVEIIPQPPGKKLSNLSLLSNGEKALTGISMLLSLFFVRTGPFLFLDEVDAPLDEGNVDRFNRLVREISDTCQIILVTHKKRSMELADFLYGVTMDRPGISRIVSAQIT